MEKIGGNKQNRYGPAQCKCEARMKDTGDAFLGLSAFCNDT